MRKPIRILVAVAAIVVAGYVVASVSRDDAPAVPPITDTGHGDVKIGKSDSKRILNAVDAITTEAPNDTLVAQGREIFRDTSLFEAGESCQTCHAEGAASAKLGTMVHDKGAPTNLDPMPPTDFTGPRDVPALWGLAKTAPYFWDGSVGTLDAALLRPVMGHMREFVAKGVPPKDGLDCTGRDADGNLTDPDCVKRAADRVAALVAYVKTLDPPTSAFDEGTLKGDALAGEKIFQGKGGCIECHGGPLFTDNLVHDTGVPQVHFDSPYRAATANPATSNDKGAPPPPPDPGCAGPTPPAGCDAAPTAGAAFINTPQMRDLKNTGPYMHNGVFKTLEQVVGFYNGRYLASDPPPPDAIPTVLPNNPASKTTPMSNLSPLNLSDGEMRDLVAYLESL